jgi:integrase
MQAFRQTLEAGVRWKLIRENPAKLAGPNPQPHRTEIVPFTIDEISRLALKLGPLYGPLVVFAAETGLRPSEWIAIQHADVQREHGVLVIERSVSRGRLKAYGKTARSRRRVPLSRRALEALDSLPRDVSTPASSSLRLAGSTSTSRTGAAVTGTRRSRPPASRRAGSTTSGIPSRRTHSPLVSASSRWRDSWGRRCA